jgi:hypothetical protein
MVQLLSVFIVALIATGSAALIASMIRSASESILKALAGDLNGHIVTLLPLRPRHRTPKTVTQMRPNPLRAAA